MKGQTLKAVMLVTPKSHFGNITEKHGVAGHEDIEELG